ncbi:Ig kappa chain V19-17-like, partial [Clarias magur]
YTKLDQVKFSTSTSLHVKGNEIMFSEDKAAGSDSPAVLFMLTVVFGAVIVILLSVLIFILKYRKTHTGSEAEDNK